MNPVNQLLTIAYSCDQAVRWATGALENVGLQVVNSFDLQLARAASSPCTCPRHGTTDCDCQMVVLLVYGASGGPATLIAHGHDGQTWLSLIETPEQRPLPHLKKSIEQALQSLIISIGFSQ